MITETQKTEIRRILGFPAIGQALNQSNVGIVASMHSYYRFYEPYEWMETRLNALEQDEEVQTFGAEHSAFASYVVPASLVATIVGATPVVGTEIQFQINGALETYVVQTGDTPAKIAAAIAAVISQDAAVNTLIVANQEGAAIQLYARTPGSAGNGVPVQAFSSDPSVTIQLGSGAAGQSVFSVMAGGGDPPGPRFVPDGSTVTTYGYVPIIRLLEADLVGARRSLTIEKVDVLTFRKTELYERAKLQDYWKRELATYLNLPLYIDFVGNRGRRSRRRV